MRKIVCSFPCQADSWHFDAAYRSGELELELVPQGNLAERIRAAGAGLGGFFTPTGFGTPLAEGKETRVIDGVPMVFESPIGADVALVKAFRADQVGNLLYRKTARNFIMSAETIPTGARGTAPLSTAQLAARVAADIRPGSYVNLGIGLPTLVGDHLPDGSGITLHTENGLLGMGPSPDPELLDPELINAGKVPVTELDGASHFHQADSFAMMRGGHIDVCVLGAFQVSTSGDLANWSTGKPGAVPAVGGAMDLAVGAKRSVVMMTLLTKDGRPKLVPECTLPLTGVRCASRVYSDVAVIDVGPDLPADGGARVVETYGVSHRELEEMLGLRLGSTAF